MRYKSKRETKLELGETQDTFRVGLVRLKDELIER